MEGKKGEGTAGGGAHPRTFVAVFLPEDEADDPYEVLLPADDTYDARYCTTIYLLFFIFFFIFYLLT